MTPLNKNLSVYMGVGRLKQGGKYSDGFTVQIKYMNKNRCLGTFADEREAGVIYARAKHALKGYTSQQHERSIKLLTSAPSSSSSSSSSRAKKRRVETAAPAAAADQSAAAAATNAARSMMMLVGVGSESREEAQLAPALQSPEPVKSTNHIIQFI